MAMLKLLPVGQDLFAKDGTLVPGELERGSGFVN
jgi:hypothetical protein